MAEGMSEREYARHAGLSRNAIAKARLTGKLVHHADGSIDPEASDRRRAETTDPSKQRSSDTARAVPDQAMAAVNETLREQGMAGGAGGVTFINARTANEVMKAQERRLNLQKRKGELVDRARAVALVFRLAREERDAWAGWPTRVAAQMAAELGVATHHMQQVLERHVGEHLRQLPEIRPEFR